jgi:outer membrane putative beta-barrel porin/alpha-amylase
MMRDRFAILFPLALSLCMNSSSALAGQPLETETARLLKPHAFEFEAGFERQSSNLGSEAAVPFALEYGISGRFELLVEPVAYNAIHDRGTPSQRGIGDIEVTLTSLLLAERGRWPAFAIAAEAKIPTAENVRIGSGKADFSAYLIGSKRTGLWDTHANLGYTIVGHPAQTQVNSVLDYAFGEEYRLSPRFDLVGELFGNTAALAEGTAAQESQLTPEIGGSELIGALGARYHAGSGLTYSLGVSLDNRNAVLVHPGLSLKW